MTRLNVSLKVTIAVAFVLGVIVLSAVRGVSYANEPPNEPQGTTANVAGGARLTVGEGRVQLILQDRVHLKVLARPGDAKENEVLAPPGEGKDGHTRPALTNTPAQEPAAGEKDSGRRQWEYKVVSAIPEDAATDRA